MTTDYGFYVKNKWIAGAWNLKDLKETLKKLIHQGKLKKETIGDIRKEREERGRDVLLAYKNNVAVGDVIKSDFGLKNMIKRKPTIKYKYYY